MKRDKVSFFKMFMSLLLSAAVLAAFVYIILVGDFEKPYLFCAAVVVCFLLSLIFIGKSQKKVFITLALALNIAGIYFLVYEPTQENQIIGISIFLGVQFFFLLYSLSLTKSIGLKVIDLAARVALSLVGCLILPRYFTLSTIDLMALVYFANSLVTLISSLAHIKTEWVSFLGFLLFLICSTVIILTNGGFEIFGITGSVVDFISKYDFAFYTYIPAILLISLSSVWQKNKK